jgi:hypothetical protein
MRNKKTLPIGILFSMYLFFAPFTESVPVPGPIARLIWEAAKVTYRKHDDIELDC